MNKFSLIWKTRDLRNKVIIVTLLLLATRVLAHVPFPGIDATALSDALSKNEFLGLLNIFSGGGLTNFSIAMMGVGPYITASIIVQLLTVIIPSWQEMQKEGGEAGRSKLNMYTRYLTVPLALLQGFGTIRLLQLQSGGLVGDFTSFEWFLTLLSITAGSMLVMWIGEIISEHGLGNGVSLVIFAGILARLPHALPALQAFYTGPDRLPVVLGFVAIALAVLVGIVVVTEALRKIPVSYARRMRGDRQVGGVDTHLPLRLNQAGVIPIIFAISLMLFPAMIANFFLGARSGTLANIAQHIISFSNNSQSLWYGVVYFVLVMVFTYFYATIVFNPDDVAENIQKNGGFIPGLRPGRQTADYLYSVLNRITLPGSLFLGAIAVLPLLLQWYTGTKALTLGGTSVLIVIAVVLETVKQVEGQLTMRDYSGVE